MTAVAECIHELAPGTCSVCSGRDKAAEISDRPDPAGFGVWFSARHHGRCSGCDEPVVPDDRIRADGDRGYVCEREGCGS